MDHGARRERGVRKHSGESMSRSQRRLPAPRPETELSRKPRYVWIGRLGSLLVRLWGRTLRITWRVPPSVRELEHGGEHLIYSFWHGHILTLTYGYRGREIVVLVSRHGDGEIISQILHRLGYGTVRGSSTRGGLRALLEMARDGRRGHPLGVTPDGPRGPRHVLQPGVLVIAQKSGLPIVPMSVGMRRGRLLDSWDRFQLPYPFSRVLVLLGDPIHVPPEGEGEAFLAEWGGRVSAAIEELETKAEAWSRGERIPELEPRGEA